MNKHLTEIILASSSPRRQEMLLGLGLTFRIMVPESEGTPEPDELPADFALRAARGKTHEIAVALKEKGEPGAHIVIGGDTIVVLGRRILGKPGDEAEARSTLRLLSGKTHEVVTGLCVLGMKDGDIHKERSLTVTTEVQFRELSDEEINAYVETGEPMDKAGAYAIQGGANYMVKQIDGSHTNVIGMPLAELVEILAEDFDYHWL